MKKSFVKEPSAQQQKDIINRLSIINRIIRNSEKREQGYYLLSELEKENLAPQQIVFCYYLNAQYYLSCFFDDNDITHLEWANDFLDDLRDFSIGNNLPVDSRFLFTRAKVKYQLAQLEWDKDDRKWLLIIAKKSIRELLRKSPSNPQYKAFRRKLSA